MDSTALNSKEGVEDRMGSGAHLVRGDATAKGWASWNTVRNRERADSPGHEDRVCSAHFVGSCYS